MHNTKTPMYRIFIYFVVTNTRSHAGSIHNYILEVGVADLQDMTLKTQVILYLIGHLENYSVDSLALLPPPLRRELLLNVPALDVGRYSFI